MSRLHFAIPLPIESLHVAAAPQQTVPRAQAASQEPQQVRRDLPSLVVDPTHHDVSTACKTKRISVLGRKARACSLRSL